MLHRVHHAAVDGASGAHAFIAMSDIDAKGTPAIAEPPPVEELGKAPSSSETLSRAWSASMQSPVKFMNALMKMSPAIVASAGSEEHTSELQSLMRISYAVFCLKNKNTQQQYQ